MIFILVTPSISALAGCDKARISLMTHDNYGVAKELGYLVVPSMPWFIFKLRCSCIGFAWFEYGKSFLTAKGRGSGKGVKEKHDFVMGVHATVNDGMDSGPGTTKVTSTLENLVTCEPSRKSVNFRTLLALLGNRADVSISLESVRAISECFANTIYGFFLGKRVAYPIVANYVKNSWSKYGLRLVRMDSITTKLSTTLMLDSHTSDMCMESWGRSSYARALIELRADVDNVSTTLIVERIDKLERQIIDGKLTLVDDDRKPLPKVISTVNAYSESEVEKVVNEHALFMASKSLKSGNDNGYGTNSLLEQWRGTKRDDDYDLYDDDDMYECHDMFEKL
ncbi:hypothetical protein Tco_0312789 [Tanacetum coccineum]